MAFAKRSLVFSFCCSQGEQEKCGKPEILRGKEKILRGTQDFLRGKKNILCGELKNESSKGGSLEGNKTLEKRSNFGLLLKGKGQGGQLGRRGGRPVWIFLCFCYSFCTFTPQIVCRKLRKRGRLVYFRIKRKITQYFFVHLPRILIFYSDICPQLFPTKNQPFWG